MEQVVISKRICPSLSQEQIIKLRQNGIRTVSDFLGAKEWQLQKIGKIYDTEYRATQQDLLRLVHETKAEGRVNVDAVPNDQISTKISRLDKVLGGGLRVGEVVEMYGLEKSGKTQMCLWIASKIVQAGRNVIWFNTNNDFNSERLISFGLKPQQLAQVLVLKTYNLGQFTTAMDVVIGRLKDQKKHGVKENSFSYINVDLVIVDAIPNIFYPSIDQARTGDIKRVVNAILFPLYDLGNIMESAVIVVNHATKARTDLYQRPALGAFWADSILTSIRLRTPVNPGPRNLREGVVERGYGLPVDVSFLISISEQGINIVKNEEEESYALELAAVANIEVESWDDEEPTQIEETTDADSVELFEKHESDEEVPAFKEEEEKEGNQEKA